MPWGRLDDSMYDHPKWDLIPEPERLAAIGLWARSISWCNRFLTDGHVPRARVEKLGDSSGIADLLVAAGLFDDDPMGYQIHDFLEFNDSREQVLERRAKETARQAEWRARKRHGVSHDVTANGSGPDVTPSVTPLVTASSRARDVTRDVARIPARPGPSESREVLKVPKPETARAAGETSKEPRLTKAELAAWADFGPEWAAFKTAWLGRGFRLPPSGDATDDDGTSQRAVLYPVVDAWPNRIAEWVVEAPGKTPHDVVAYVLAQRTEVRRDAGGEEDDWFAEKRAERAEAPARLADVMARLGESPQ